MLSVPVEGVVHAAQKTHPSLCVSDALAPKGDCKQHKALVVPPRKKKQKSGDGGRDAGRCSRRVPRLISRVVWPPGAAASSHGGPYSFLPALINGPCICNETHTLAETEERMACFN